APGPRAVGADTPHRSASGRPADVGARVHDLSGGNPCHVLELVSGPRTSRSAGGIAMIRANKPLSTPPQTPAPVEPSYAPFLLALGITMIFWGVVTSPIMSIGGFVLLVWGLSLS